MSRTSCEEEGAERRKHTLARVSQDFLDDTSALITDSDFGITDICTLERASGTFQSRKKMLVKKDTLGLHGKIYYVLSDSHFLWLNNHILQKILFFSIFLFRCLCYVPLCSHELQAYLTFLWTELM